MVKPAKPQDPGTSGVSAKPKSNWGGKRAGAGAKRGQRRTDYIELEERIVAAVAEQTKHKPFKGRHIIDYDPVVEMAMISTDDEYSASERLTAHKEVSQYVRAKRKAIEISGPGGEPLSEALLMDPSVRSQMIQEMAARLKALE